MARQRRRRRYGAHRLRPAHVPYAADRSHDARTDELSRLPDPLVAWLTTTGARLLWPTLDEPQWRVRLGARLLASSNTAHNALLAAQARLRTHPIDALPHLGA